MKFTNDKLKERILDIYDRMADFASDLGISRKSVIKKLNGDDYFTEREIIKAVQLLDIEPIQIKEYFFTLMV